MVVCLLFDVCCVLFCVCGLVVGCFFVVRRAMFLLRCLLRVDCSVQFVALIVVRCLLCCCSMFVVSGFTFVV